MDTGIMEESSQRKQVQRPLCVRDMAGIVCVSFVYVLMALSTYTIIFKIILRQFVMGPGMVSAIALCLLLDILIISSHANCMLSDPGAVPAMAISHSNESYSAPAEAANWCRQCQCYKAEQTHHCKVCQMCVQRMDHHCPWVNNCVGAANTKFFLLFLKYTCLKSIFAVALLVSHLLSCSRAQWQAKCSTVIDDSTWLGVLFLMALVFGLFTGGMLIDMLCSIRANTTTIGKLQEEYGEKRPFCTSMEMIFGTKPSICWAVPCSRPPQSYNWNEEGVSLLADVEMGHVTQSEGLCGDTEAQ